MPGLTVSSFGSAFLWPVPVIGQHHPVTILAITANSFYENLVRARRHRTGKVTESDTRVVMLELTGWLQRIRKLSRWTMPTLKQMMEGGYHHHDCSVPPPACQVHPAKQQHQYPIASLAGQNRTYAGWRSGSRKSTDPVGWQRLPQRFQHQQHVQQRRQSDFNFLEDPTGAKFEMRAEICIS
jgi:hypothetical protein